MRAQPPATTEQREQSDTSVRSRSTPMISLEAERDLENRPRYRVPTVPESPAKRGMDILLAAVGLVVSAPLWPLIAAAVKLEDGGPVFFTQPRVGKGGEIFMGHKFRSMTPRERRKDVPGQAELEDHRITRMGRLMRATALDELPQLWNILKGDMSFVGPRALLPAEEEANGDGDSHHLHELSGYDERHAVRPGLTGLAQVCAPRDLPRKKKFRYDLLYVRKKSVRLDIYLFVKSVWISLRGKWPEVGREGCGTDGSP